MWKFWFYFGSSKGQMAQTEESSILQYPKFILNLVRFLSDLRNLNNQIKSKP